MSSSLVVGEDTLFFGGKTIAAGQRVRGPVVVAGGDLVVAGTIEGDAISIIGDVVVSAGGHVTGNAVSALGKVHSNGTIDGTARTLSTVTANFADDAQAKPAKAAPRSTTDALRLSMGWLIVMLLIGLGVLVFAGSYLDGVVDVLEQSFWRSLGIGLIGGLGLVPLLVLLIVVLAVSIIGILLIPFAAVAYLIAAAGLATLGFLAVARVTGNSIGSTAASRLSARGSTLRSLLVGIVVYLGLWVLAASLSWAPIPAAVLRTLAFALTCVAATAGFGAALLSRAGTRREVGGAPTTAAPEPAAWQTPTPVTGVSAARRASMAGAGRSGSDR
ncbi:MAG: polymer-forming cytoskeletal protein [Gemmatimonadaceae bacterium]